MIALFVISAAVALWVGWWRAMCMFAAETPANRPPALWRAQGVPGITLAVVVVASIGMVVGLYQSMAPTAGETVATMACGSVLVVRWMVSGLWGRHSAGA